MGVRSFLTGEESPATVWWTRYGLVVAGGLLALAVGLAIYNFVASAYDHDQIAVQSQSELALERLMSNARDMETGSRGFVLVGSDRYLEPYRASIAGLAGADQELRDAWRRAGGAPETLAALFAELDHQRAYLARLVELRRREGFEPAQALVATGEGKQSMDALRAIVAKLQAEVSGRRTRIERRDRFRSIILTTLSIGAAFAACAYMGWLVLVRRRVARLATAELVGLGDRFRALADNIPQLAWMADPKGDIYWYNQRWYDYTGRTQAEMAKHGWQSVHDPAYLEGASRSYFDAVRAGTTWRDTFPLRRHDGEFRWFLSMAQPIHGPRGEIVRWFGTNTDITEQRRQEEELAAARDSAEEANQAKSQFLANMSHELRTPLSAVIGYSEMLEEEVEELGEKHLLDDLAKIKANARHLLSLINDVLDISKIEANKMEVFAETFDIGEMIEDVAATVGSLVDKKGNRLVVEVREGLGSAHSDVVKLRQILINLLSNAAKFTEGGEIRLIAERKLAETGDLVVFTIRDTGLGMTEEQVAKLFERFTQADVSTTRRFGGTGLGLAITKAFADLLGGAVSVESRAGEGSTFTVTVPAVMPAGEEPGAARVVEATGRDETSVLVIDDDEATRDLLTRFLTREGYTVQVAADGRSGLALAEALKPRVILLDVTMPRMDGWTVLRSLKDDPNLAAIPVIMCTIIDEQTLGFSLGASDYVLKPVNWERLREVLARVQKDTAAGHVLIVDDDADTRARLNGILARNGWTVAEAENGRAALEAVRARLPNLVLLDLNMPEMDGFTFLREFRSAPEWASVPVVVMTARDLSARERAELKGGGAQVFEKGSVSMQDLVSQIRALQVPRSPAHAPAQSAA